MYMLFGVKHASDVECRIRGGGGVGGVVEVVIVVVVVVVEVEVVVVVVVVLAHVFQCTSSIHLLFGVYGGVI